jgi:hypothetical protein
MALIIDDKPTGPPKEYPIASEGPVMVVVADVEDLGIQNDDLYGPKPKIRLTWVLDEKDPEGNYFVIRREFTASMHEKSNLYPVVQDILGKVPPVPYDLENLVGKSNLGIIKRKLSTKGKSNGKTFANIVSFLTAKPGQSFAVPADFVRGKDGGVYGKLPQSRNSQPNQQPRTAAPTQRVAPAQPVSKQEIADEDIPF